MTHSKTATIAGFLSLLAATSALADDVPTYKLVISNHKFDPAEIKVPAGKPIILQVKNLDADAEEFDSDDLKTEKIIAGKSEGTIHLRPLKAGTYKFEGEYHSDSAHGVVIAQ